MLWYMNSKDMDLFLNNETDDDILEAQYVIVSNRIRRVGTAHDNIIQASVLFPDPSVCVHLDTDDFNSEYYSQLDKNKTLLAMLIRTSILQQYNIIFLCTKKETKLGNYLEKISRYIYNEFDYPMYNYKDFATGKIEEVSYDEARVFEKCNKVVKLAKNKDIMNKINSERKLSDKDKKTLKKLLKKEGLYEKNMTVHEMKNIASVFNLDIG